MRRFRFTERERERVDKMQMEMEMESERADRLKAHRINIIHNEFLFYICDRNKYDEYECE